MGDTEDWARAPAARASDKYSVEIITGEKRRGLVRMGGKGKEERKGKRGVV